MTTDNEVTLVEARRSIAGIDPRLLEILVCPVTHTPLSYNRDAQELVSAATKLAYPIRDGIPILILDEARKLSD